MKQLFFGLISILVILSSCQMVGGKRVKGDGNVTKLSHSIRAFKNLDISGNIEVWLTQDSVPSLVIETDDNLRPFIAIRQDGDLLSIDTRNGYSLDPTHKIIAHVSCPAFSGVRASGACVVIGKNKVGQGQPITFDLSGACEVNMDLRAEKVNIQASGACNLKLSGEVRDQDIDASGACEIRNFGLLTENTKIDMSGAGDAEVFASLTLKARTSGASDIRYKGEAKVTQEISGAGSVKKE